MSQLILGTVQFGLDYGVNNSIGRPDFDKVVKILDTANRNGIIKLDTADAYGESQSVLRNYFSQYSNRFQVMSKFIWEKNKDFNFHLRRSLEQLGISQLDSYYFHRFEDFVNFKYFDQIHESKKLGLLKMLGVSLYSLEDLEFVCEHTEVDLIQLPFNLLDNDINKQDLLLKAKRNGKKVYVRSAFLQGLFFKNPADLPLKLNELSKDIQRIKIICNENNLSVEQLCLGYLKSKKFIDGILIGVDSESQLLNNLDSFKTILSTDAIKEIESIKVNNSLLLNPVNWN